MLTLTAVFVACVVVDLPEGGGQAKLEEGDDTFNNPYAGEEADYEKALQIAKEEADSDSEVNQPKESDDDVRPEKSYHYVETKADKKFDALDTKMQQMGADLESDAGDQEREEKEFQAKNADLREELRRAQAAERDEENREREERAERTEQGAVDESLLQRHALPPLSQRSRGLSTQALLHPTQFAAHNAEAKKEADALEVHAAGWHEDRMDALAVQEMKLEGQDPTVLTDYLEGKKASDNFVMPKELQFEDQWKKEIGPLSDQLHKDEKELDEFAMGPAVEKEIASHWTKQKVKTPGFTAAQADLRIPALRDQASLLQEGDLPAVPSVPVVDKKSEQQLFQDDPRIAEESQKFSQWTDKLIGQLGNLDADKKDSMFQEIKEMKERDADIEKKQALMESMQVDAKGNLVKHPHHGHHQSAHHAPAHQRPQKHHLPKHHPDPLANEHSGTAHKSQHTNEGKTAKVHHHRASSLAQASERDIPMDPVEAKLDQLQAKMQAQTRAFEAAAKHDALVEEGAVGASLAQVGQRQIPVDDRQEDPRNPTHSTKPAADARATTDRELDKPLPVDAPPDADYGELKDDGEVSDGGDSDLDQTPQDDPRDGWDVEKETESDEEGPSANGQTDTSVTDTASDPGGNGDSTLSDGDGDGATDGDDTAGIPGGGLLQATTATATADPLGAYPPSGSDDTDDDDSLPEQPPTTSATTDDAPDPSDPSLRIGDPGSMGAGTSATSFLETNDDADDADEAIAMKYGKPKKEDLHPRVMPPVIPNVLAEMPTLEAEGNMERLMFSSDVAGNVDPSNTASSFAQIAENPDDGFAKVEAKLKALQEKIKADTAKFEQEAKAAPSSFAQTSDPTEQAALARTRAKTAEMMRIRGLDQPDAAPASSDDAAGPAGATLGSADATLDARLKHMPNMGELAMREMKQAKELMERMSALNKNLKKEGQKLRKKEHDQMLSDRLAERRQQESFLETPDAQDDEPKDAKDSKDAKDAQDAPGADEPDSSEDAMRRAKNDAEQLFGFKPTDGSLLQVQDAPKADDVFDAALHKLEAKEDAMKAENAKMEKEFGVMEKVPESSFLETAPKLTSKEQFTQLLARMHEAAVDMRKNANAWKSGKTASFLETGASARAEDDKMSDDRWAKVGSSLDHLEEELRSNKQNWHKSLDIPASLAEIRRQSAKYRALKAQLQAQQADTEATSLLQDHQETASDEQARNELRAFEQGMAKEYAALPASVKAKQTSLLETAKRNRFYGDHNKEVEEDRIAEMQGFEDGGKADLAAIARSPQEQLRKEIQDTQYSIGQ